jgi:hypothetical protein
MNQQTPRGTPWETYCRSVLACGLDMNIMHRVMADELGVSRVSPVSSHPAPTTVGSDHAVDMSDEDKDSVADMLQPPAQWPEKELVVINND